MISSYDNVLHPGDPRKDSMNRLLVSTGADSNVLVWNVSKPMKPKIIGNFSQLHANWCMDLVFLDLECRNLASCGWDGNAYRYDLEKMVLEKAIDVSDSYEMNTLKYSHSDGILYLGRKIALMYDIRSNKIIKEVSLCGSPSDFYIDEEKKQLYVGDWDGKLAVFDTRKLETRLWDRDLNIKSGHNRITSVSPHLDNEKMIIVSGEFRNIHFINKVDGTIVKTLKEEHRIYGAIYFNDVRKSKRSTQHKLDLAERIEFLLESESESSMMKIRVMSKDFNISTIFFLL